MSEGAPAPWLTVVMPTYRGADVVGGALASVADQACGSVGSAGVRVVVVDDGSDDGTVAAVEAAAADRRLDLELLTPGRLGGWTAATNHGLEHVTTPWVCFLHQDDHWLPGRAAALAAATHGHPDAGLVLSPAAFVDDGGRSLGTWRLPWRGAAPAPAEVAERLWVQNFLSVPGTAFPAAALQEVGGLDTDLWYTADWDLWLRLAQRSTKVVSLSQPGTAFRIHAGSQTATASRDSAGFRRQLTVVQDRHEWALPTDQRRRAAVMSAGRLSTEVNVALAAVSHSQTPAWRPLTAAAAHPAGWHRFLRDSRIMDRLGPRLRAGMHRRPADAQLAGR